MPPHFIQIYFFPNQKANHKVKRPRQQANERQQNSQLGHRDFHFIQAGSVSSALPSAQNQFELY